MSLPREIREELLSAYLDDALRGDERTRVEQLLATDEDAKRLFEQMREIRASTKAAMRSNRRPAAGLSRRVIATAMARAEQTGLPAEHHVRVAASRGGKAKASPRRNWNRQYGPAAVALTLAASLLLAVTLWNADSKQDLPGGTNQPGGIANLAPAEAGAPRDLAAEGIADAENRVEVSSDAGSLADAEKTSTVLPDEAPMEFPSNEGPAAEALATAEMDRTGRDNEQATREDPTESMAADREANQGLDGPAAMLATQAVMMFEVEQTEAGRANNAVLQAMRNAGIQADLKQRVTDAVVGYLQKAQLVADGGDTGDQAAASSPVSVVYVEASGKQLDQFMLSLFKDTEQVARIGWNLAMDAPVVDAATQIEKIVATDVRHAESTSAAWQLVTGDAQQGFAAPGAGREFFPINRSDPSGWEAVGSADTGPDIRSKLLILIR